LRELLVFFFLGSLASAAPPPEIVSPPMTADELTYEVLFTRVLQPRCLSCHCPDITCDANDYLFTPYQNLLATKLWQPPAAMSRVIKAVTRTDKHRMPPPNAGSPLSEDDVDLIARWIDAGNPP